MTTIPTGFLLVVGLGVFLIAVLAILTLAYLIDAAKTLRAIAHQPPQAAQAAEDAA